MLKLTFFLRHLLAIHSIKFYLFLSTVVSTWAFAPIATEVRIINTQSLHYLTTRNVFQSRGSSCNPRSNLYFSTPSRPNNNQESNHIIHQRSDSWIVLVDDSESIRNSVGQYLFDAGYTVSACADAEALIELLTLTSSSSSVRTKHNNMPSKLPSVIICDVRMPGTGMDGLELLDLLKNSDSSKVRVTSPSSDLDFVRQQWRKIPVVMLTAKSLTQDRIEGYRKGADVYLPKPFVPEELLSIVDNLIGRMKALTRRDDGEKSSLRDVKADIIEIKSMLKATECNLYAKSQDNSKIPRQAVIPNRLPGHNQIPPRLEQANSSAIVPSWNKSEARSKNQHDMDQVRGQVHLTNVEKDILTLLSQGNTNGEIAEAMGFTNVKVSRLISNMYAKTFTKTRTELVRWAIEMGHISAS
jgi:Response regulators consisting of a CheY-like receiver domain and a winged-helix DNA-binding domain